MKGTAFCTPAPGGNLPTYATSCTHMYMCMYSMCMCMCMRMRMCICMCICMFMYVYVCVCAFDILTHMNLANGKLSHKKCQASVNIWHNLAFKVAELNQECISQTVLKRSFSWPMSDLLERF